MLPLVDKPTIQYGVEEAVAAGVSNIILVTGRGKNAIEDHFDVSAELETFLESRGKLEQLEEIRKISQDDQRVLRSPGRTARPGSCRARHRERRAGEPFAVILGDDVIDAEPPALAADDRRFERADGPVIAVERVPEEQVSSYGIVDVEPAPQLGPRVYRIRDMVEKPPRAEAPSNLAIIGRYILTPDIFPALRETTRDKSGEIQLTNGIAAAAPAAPDVRLRDRWRPPRHRQQAGVPESGRLLRGEAARSGRVRSASISTRSI